MTDLLAPGGCLAATIPDYEDRPEQRAMAAAVAIAIDDERVLVVEAGTGTGKTLAYLIPALQSGKRVVVSTGTRTLQEQITRHDLPLLADLLERPFVAVPLKGVSNYVCQRRLHELTARSAADSMSPELTRVQAWIADTETGDRAELAERDPTIPDNAPIWDQLTATPETRLGSRCPFFERCYVTRARRRAERADLILVNHHLFLADLALRRSHPGARVLPDYDAVVFDEGHQLEEVITDHFGISVSSLRTSQLGRELERILTRDELFQERSAARHFLDRMERCASAFFTTLRASLLANVDPDSDRIELPVDLFADRHHHRAWLDLDTALDELRVHTEVAAETRLDAAPRDEAIGLCRRIERLRDDLATLAERATDNLVYWGELRGTGVALHGSPVEVGEVMSREILDSVSSVVVTSATLTTGGSFRYLRERLGLDGEQIDELTVASPFDYANQALLYVSTDLPWPRQPGFTAACCQRIAELLAITEGRAFVLFTSHRALREAARTLERTLPYPLLVQGREPRASLLERFRTTPHPVLLATGAFWEGVDVPGDALSQVIIDKLPFAPPTDPLTAARMRRLEEREVDPFAAYQLPRAALALKQGFGRLIRRRDDRGIVALLDGRLLGKGYGRVFLDTLPGAVPRTASIERVRRWWGSS